MEGMLGEIAVRNSFDMMNHHPLFTAGGSAVNGATLGAFFWGHLPEWAAALAVIASLAQIIRFLIDIRLWWRHKDNK